MTAPKRRLLIAEDDVEQLESWRRDIDEFNKRADRKVTFVPYPARSAVEAVEKLAEINIDCAIIDLRLPRLAREAEDASRGNELRALVEREFPIPVAIHTAHIGELDEAGQTSIMKSFTKDAGQSTNVLEWLADKAQIMEALATTSQKLKHETARVFHGSVWPRWQAAKENDKVPNRFDKIVTRQVVSHLAEEFSLPLADIPAHHLQEFYYLPPMREKLHTGDLLHLDDTVFVIVTPQCDIVNDYPKNFLLAKCSAESDEWTAIESAVATNQGKVGSRSRGRISGLTTHAREQRFHFLPPCGNEGGPWFVDFTEMLTVPSDRAEELLQQRFASIAAPFVPNLVHRFAAFLGRIGQPELDIDALAEHLEEGYKNAKKT